MNVYSSMRWATAPAVNPRSRLMSSAASARCFQSLNARIGVVAGGFGGPGLVNIDHQLGDTGLGAHPRAFGLGQLGQQRVAAVTGLNRHIMARFAVVVVAIPRVIHTINTSSHPRQNTPKTDDLRKIVRKSFPVESGGWRGRKMCSIRLG